MVILCNEVVKKSTRFTLKKTFSCFLPLLYVALYEMFSTTLPEPLGVIDLAEA